MLIASIIELRNVRTVHRASSNKRSVIQSEASLSASSIAKIVFKKKVKVKSFRLKSDDRSKYSVVDRHFVSNMVDADAKVLSEIVCLDPATTDSELNQLWEAHWLANGEEIIWKSWLDKYQNYINADYTENLTAPTDFDGSHSGDDKQLSELLEDLAIMDDNTTSCDVETIHPSENGLDSAVPLSTENESDTSAHDTEAANQRWQELWTEHYNEQYNESHYEFMTKKRKLLASEHRPISELIDGIVDEDTEYEQQMKELGLPAAFGRRNNLKKNLRKDVLDTEYEQEVAPEMDELDLPTAFGRPNNNSQNISLDNLSTSTGTSNTLDDLIVADMPLPKRKRKKNKNKRRALPLPEEIANDKTLMKYWSKRFSLFSLFDEGIKLDRESWFSVTPEKIAAYTASRCKCDIIIDAFCGAGGNTIQFAKLCRKVIAIDIDPTKIEMAKHNARVYEVSDKIEFIIGSYVDLADSLVADAVFLSPPWGGPEYLKNEVYDVEKYLLPVPASQLMDISRRISSNICIYLPRNSDKTQLCRLAGPGHSVEVNQEFLGSKLVAISAYYGDLIKKE